MAHLWRSRAVAQLNLVSICIMEGKDVRSFPFYWAGAITCSQTIFLNLVVLVQNCD